MARYMKGQVIEGEGGKFYQYLGGDDHDKSSFKEVQPNSPQKDIGLASLSGGAQGIMDLGQGMATPIQGMLGPIGGGLMRMGMEAYRKQIPEYQPQTDVGRYAGAGARGAASSAVLGPMGALSGLAGGLGGEAGSDFTGGSRWGRLAGGLTGGLLPNLPGIAGGLTSRRIRSATTQDVSPGSGFFDSALKALLLREKTPSMKPADWAASQAAQEQAAAQGIRLTGPEAIGQRAPDLLSKQLMVEQHPKSAGIMAQVMNERPGQVKQAVSSMLNQTGASVVDPALLGARVQTAAKEAIDRARQAGNAAAQSRYTLAEQQRIPSSEWNTLTANPVVLDALTQVKKSPYYGIAASEPAGSVRWLDAAKKYLDDAGSSFERTGANYAASQAGKGAATVRGAADASSPDYAAARGIVEQNLRQNVEPRKLSATGALSETPDPVAQFGRLSDPALSRPGVIKQTARDIQSVDPTAYRQLVRTGLETQFDTAMKQMATGGQQFGGAKLARTLRGTDQTRANIEATIGALPDGPQLVVGWNRLLDTLEATGNRLPVGSRTAFNQLQASELTGSGLLRQGISSQPLAWMERIEQNISAKKLAKIFADPESVKKMKELAITKPNTAKARAIVGGLFGGTEE